MPASHLIAIPNSAPATANQDQPELGVSGAQRIRRLQDQARALAREEMSLFQSELAVLAARAGEISEGGEVYPPGVRELALRICDELGMHSKLLQAIIDRTSH